MNTELNRIATDITYPGMSMPTIDIDPLHNKKTQLKIDETIDEFWEEIRIKNNSHNNAYHIIEKNDMRKLAIKIDMIPKITDLYHPDSFSTPRHNTPVKHTPVKEKRHATLTEGRIERHKNSFFKHDN